MSMDQQNSVLLYLESELDEGETEVDISYETTQYTRTRSTAGGGAADDDREEIAPLDAMAAIAAEGDQLLHDMFTATIVYPPNFDVFMQNMAFNRVPHLPCYDHTRVILRDKLGAGNYINASHVDGYTGKDAYIFSQAPFNQETTNQFWRMAWQERPSIIVVLGAIDEKQIKKDGTDYDIGQKNFEKTFAHDFGKETFAEAEQLIHIPESFWPVNMSERLEFGKDNHLAVQNNGVYKETHVDVINMTISEGRDKSATTALVHFKDWMDESPLPEFLPDMRATIKLHHIRCLKKPTAFTGPILLVCPTGIARCGIYAILDVVLTRLTEEHSVGIKESMQAIKSQRYGCFRNVEHYKGVREMITRFAITSGIVHENAIGEKMASTKKVKNPIKKKKFFNIKQFGK